MTFVREFFFIDLSISAREGTENEHARKMISSMTLFDTRDRPYGRILIRKFLFKNVDSTIEKFLEDFLMFHVFMMIERVDRIKRIMHAN